MSNWKQTNRIIVKASFGIALFCMMILCNTIHVHGDTKQEAYELLTYKQNTVVQKNHQYDVSLELTINVPEELSSINVNLPSGNYKLDISGADNCAAQSRTDANDNKYIQVTPASGGSFKAGKSTFTLNYSIREYAETNTDYDMFLYDAVASNWNVSMGELDITIEFPDDFDFTDLQYYAGQYEAQDVQNTLKYSLDGNVLHLTGTRIPENFGITFKAQLQDGYWEDALDNAWTIKLGMIILGATTLLIFLLWLIGGRDIKVSKTEEKQPIEGVSPVDVGFLFNGRTRIRDIAILLVYLGIQGYLKIVEYAPKKYTLARLKDPKDEERYVRMAYNILFEDVYEGRTLDPKYFHSRMRTIRKMVGTSIENGYGAKDMKACTTISQILRLISIVILAISMTALYNLTKLYSFQDITLLGMVAPAVLVGALVVVINSRFDSRYDTELMSYRVTMILFVLIYTGMIAVVGFQFWQTSGNFILGIMAVVCGLISLDLTLIMKRRGKGNAKLVSRILCLRDYISSVSASELAREGAITPEKYYELLPYALAFSQEEIWARKFRWIGPRGSEFYEVESEGNTMATNRTRNRTESIARDLKNFCRTVESEYHMTSRRRRLF